jgi:2-haloacid dehalogenase
MPLGKIKSLHFDVFGTVVDWRTSVVAELEDFGKSKGIEADWVQFADDWRDLYQPSMDGVRRGDREWRTLDTLHRESLITLISRHQITGLTEEEIDHLNKAWHRLAPWPDCVEGLTRLKKKYILATLSNGNVSLLVNMAKHGGLPWDAILGAEPNRAYKPMPQCYLGNARYLDLEPAQCMLVAAHNGDLATARSHGYRTAFVCRPAEYGPGQDIDMKAESDWDIVTDSMNGVADALKCD